MSGGARNRPTPGERVYLKRVSRVRIPLCPMQRTGLRSVRCFRLGWIELGGAHLVPSEGPSERWYRS